MSFSNNPREYVSMWAMYGKPSGIKLRIDFPSKLFNESINNNFYFDSNCMDRISVYQMSSDPITKKDYKISDVICYDKSDNKLQYNTSSIDNLAVDDRVIQELAGFIKYSAWEFERETRLRVLLNDNNNDGHLQYIYARLNNQVIREFKITYNPWISSSLQSELQISIDRLAGCALSHNLSTNHGEIREL